MSTLTRSLLALAALLAAADAVEVIDLAAPGSLCTGFKALAYNDTQFGVTTITTEFQVQTNVPKNMHEIKNNCRPLNLVMASQTVKACNGYQMPDAPHWFPPNLQPSASFSPIYASCDSNQCLPIVFEITQKCIPGLKNRRNGK